MKKILYIALILSIVTYSFWESFPKGSFYVLNALFIMLLCIYLFLTNKKSFVCFVLLCYSFNNLADELFFNPTKLQINELVFAVFVPLVWILKILYYDGTITRK